MSGLVLSESEKTFVLHGVEQNFRYVFPSVFEPGMPPYFLSKKGTTDPQFSVRILCKNSEKQNLKFSMRIFKLLLPILLINFIQFQVNFNQISLCSKVFMKGENGIRKIQIHRSPSLPWNTLLIIIIFNFISSATLQLVFF